MKKSFRKAIAFLTLISLTSSAFAPSISYAQDASSSDGQYTFSANGSTIVPASTTSGSVSTTGSVLPAPTTHSHHADHTLKNTFSGKKLSRVQASITTKNSYRVLIQSSDSLASIGAFLTTEKSEQTHQQKSVRLRTTKTLHCTLNKFCVQFIKNHKN